MRSELAPSHRDSDVQFPYLNALLKLEDDYQASRPLKRDLSYYFLEQYSGDATRWLRLMYYSARPLIPKRLKLALHRRYAAVRTRNVFPAWPIEPIVVDDTERCLRRLLEEGQAQAIYRIAPWPAGYTFAFCLTHDIEQAAGFESALLVRQVEQRYGFYSSWNIVPQGYAIDWASVDILRSQGCEIGIHGYNHDGKLFRGRKLFNRRCARINQCAKEWGAVGFRSESTLRNPKWMSDLAFEYDSSFPDTDPYEPQPGGCCSIWPFFIGNIVELPLTMTQDNTLFNVLRQLDISAWTSKADWIREKGGLVLLDTHPDYLVTDEYIKRYDQFLEFMAGHQQMWYALPRDIARWWRDRDASVLRKRNGVLTIEGPIAGRAAIIETKLQDRILKHRFIENDRMEIHVNKVNSGNLSQIMRVWKSGTDQAQGHASSMQHSWIPLHHEGELVRIRKREEILSTLDATSSADGCLFMTQMWGLSGTTHRVKKIVNNYFDEHTLKMYRCGAPLYLLDGLICDGEGVFGGRCDRSCFLLWHEQWLDNTDGD